MSAIVLSVEYQINGGASEPTLTRLTTALERAGAELADIGKHVMPKLLPVLEVETSKQFEAEGGGPQSGSWAPLSVSYSAWKEAHYPGQPKLVATGALRAALTDSSASGALRDVSGAALSFGTAGIPYASLHQTGTGRMPSRPPFDFGSGFEAGVQAAAAAGVREAVRAGSDGLIDFEGDEFEGQQVMTGRSGGRYVVSNGARTYLKRNAAGAVVKQKFRGKQ